MSKYEATGNLTGYIDDENMDAARKYLAEDDMTQFIDANLEDVVLHVEWSLTDNSQWRVLMVTARDLTEDELKQMNEWASGQNSDGLGEGFEQQDFAWTADEECGECEDCEQGYECYNESRGEMVSFDWATRELEFKKSEVPA